MSGSEPLTRDVLRRYLIPAPQQQGDKEARGRVLVVGGSVEVPGAVMLAGIAALRIGAGKIQLAVPRTVAVPLAIAVPEARVFALAETPGGGIDPAEGQQLAERARDCAALLIGPGMFEPEAAAQLASDLLQGADEAPAVLDACAMAALPGCAAALGATEPRVVITPHPGEMAHLIERDRDAIEADPLAAAREAAARFGVVVVLKSARTHIVAPAGEAFHIDEGTIGLATAGSGDVLSGVIAGLLARGAAPLAAALWGVHLHREAGARLAQRIASLGYLARELLPELPRVLAAQFGR